MKARKTEKSEPRDLTFTVLYLPVESANGGSAGRLTGFQVIVPVLPGLVTFGRTLQEAEKMARDAIECHIEGLRKSGEPIPDERLARSGKLRVALSA